MQAQYVVVGAGLAGLAAARRLHAAGADFLLLEAADRPGGRVKTDEVDGFLLDRGFQIMLSAYGEYRDLVDPRSLDLRSFYPGADVFYQGSFHRLADPTRHPVEAATALVSPVVQATDIPRLLRLRRAVTQRDAEEISDQPIAQYLEELGLSNRIISAFFRPFLAGINFDPDLQTSARMLGFTFSKFAAGNACLPSRGMETIPREIAAPLPPESLKMNNEVAELDRGQRRLTLRTGEAVHFEKLIVATEFDTADTLTGNSSNRQWSGTVTLNFALEGQPPVLEPTLILNGGSDGVINHACFPSNVSEFYAPEGMSLFSASTACIPDINRDDLETEARRQLKYWFGSAVDHWSLLEVQRIPRALPDQRSIEGKSPLSEYSRTVCDNDSTVLRAGDYLETSSIEGALRSGRIAAELVLRRK